MRLRSSLQFPRGDAAVVFVAVAIAFAGIWFRPFTYVALAIVIGFVVWRLVPRGNSKRWLERAVNPIILHPPFEDRWYVAAGGPDFRHNHHAVVSDQYFAYDFLREGGEEWDQPIVAPCAGMIVHVENRQPDAPPSERHRDTRRPFGNYVSIQTGRGYVILAHLRQGSIVVRVGESVDVGQPIGRCGNSGNTDRAHLHLHAQNQPSQSIDVAEGIPVAFVDRLRSEPLLLEYGDRLG